MVMYSIATLRMQCFRIQVWCAQYVGVGEGGDSEDVDVIVAVVYYQLNALWVVVVTVIEGETNSPAKTLFVKESGIQTSRWSVCKDAVRPLILSVGSDRNPESFSLE